MLLVGKWPAQEREVERLRGGFGGAFGWLALVLSVLVGVPMAFLALLTLTAGEGLAGLCCGSFTLLAAFCGLWPLLRSSTYVLTNRRLIVAPRFGSTVAIPLSQLDRGKITVDPLTSSLTLHSERPIVLRYIRRSRQLWGLLLVVSHARQAQDDLFVDPTQRSPQDQRAPLRSVTAETRGYSEKKINSLCILFGKGDRRSQ
ncbi:MAG TPA: hypothetical protein VHC22_08250 [Pirellulales bacterium]|nr:hypothetical protein [Pirellulales bacterium]